MNIVGKSTRALTLAGALSLALLGVTAPHLAAKEGLNDEQEVFDRVLIGAIVSETYKNCKRLAPRKIKATFYVLGTVRFAHSLGYSMEDIDNYRYDPVQQERLRVAVLAYFAEHKVDPEDPETYCIFGETEIANDSQIGTFLKRK